MREFVKTAIAAVAAGCLGTQAMAATVNVYVTAGASNSIGVQHFPYSPQPADSVVRLYHEYGTVTKPGTQLDYTDGEIPPGDPPDAPRWLQIVPREPGNLAPIEFHGVLRSGHEITFGRIIYNRYGAAHNPVIIKYGIGASSLEYHWTNSATIDLSDRMLLFLSQVRRIIENSGDNFVMRSFYWNQGESDTNEQFEADNYFGNLQRLIGKVRNFAGNPKLPVMVARTHFALALMSPAQQQLRRKGFVAVRQAQLKFTQTDPCAILINVDDLKHDEDHVHFKPMEYAVIAQRVYQGMLAIEKRPACR